MEARLVEETPEAHLRSVQEIVSEAPATAFKHLARDRSGLDLDTNAEDLLQQMDTVDTPEYYGDDKKEHIPRRVIMDFGL